MPQLQYKFNKNDEYNTPRSAVIPIMKHIKSIAPNSTIWCPFDKADSEFVKVFHENGFRVIYTHIADGQDFFDITPSCDYIVSNPPYSLKGKVFERLYEIGKPFAMLINFQGIFDSKDRFEMFKSHRIEMLWLSPRVNYIKQGEYKPSGVPFQSGYLCSGICENQLEFEYINKEESNENYNKR